jgi:hypothetical protein
MTGAHHQNFVMTAHQAGHEDLGCPVCRGSHRRA